MANPSWRFSRVWDSLTRTGPTSKLCLLEKWKFLSSSLYKAEKGAGRQTQTSTVLNIIFSIVLKTIKHYQWKLKKKIITTSEGKKWSCKQAALFYYFHFSTACCSSDFSTLLLGFLRSTPPAVSAPQERNGKAGLWLCRDSLQLRGAVVRDCSGKRADPSCFTYTYPHFEGVTKPNARDTRQRKLHGEDRQSGAGSPQLLFGAYPQNSKIGQQLAQDKNQYVRKFLSVKQKSNLIIFFKSLLPISNQLWKTTE